MKIATIFFVLLAFLFTACSSSEEKSADKDKLRAEINKVEALCYADEEMKPGVANEAIMVYSKFVYSFPKDSLASEYLFRAAELCKSLEDGKRALEFYQRIEKEYPDCSQLPMTVFFQGLVNETLLDNTEEAKAFYTRFLKEYPSHPYAADVKEILKNVEVDPLELIRTFEEKNKEIIDTTQNS
jgi:tetratricopeptide (TPR) repeat protein